MGSLIHTVDGRELRILYSGIHNRDAGPDFTGARIVIGDEEWCGNIEVHVRASDWNRHGHSSDPAYSNIILHVVGVDDYRIKRADGSEIPQMVVSFPESFYRMYAALSEKINNIHCQEWLHLVPSINRADWLGSLTIERIQSKSRRILDMLESLNGDWAQTCFVALARALGFNLNGEPMEMMARSLPLRILLHHSDNPLQLEALLFGQAGMLDTSCHIFDEYYQTLGREYFFLARKYGLRPLNLSIWKYARTRPSNFPHRRIAMLACAVTGGFSLMSDILESRYNPDRIRALFNWQPSGYWDNHSDFDVPGTANAPLSVAMLDLLLINFTAPLLYAYAAANGNPDLGDSALDIWYSLAPENNIFIRQWIRLGISCSTAADSQALLQLKREYCDHNRCLDCRFAAKMFKSTVN